MSDVITNTLTLPRTSKGEKPSGSQLLLAQVPYTLIACHNQNNELLVVKRNKPPFVGCWNFIGGKIEPHESPTLAAIREINEEAGRHATVRDLSFRGIALWPNPFNPGRYLGMFMFHFRCRTHTRQTEQLGLLHEGVTSWIHLSLLMKSDGVRSVPNFALIASHIMNTRRAPHIVCHNVIGDIAHVMWAHAIPRSSLAVVNKPLNNADIRINDLVGNLSAQ